MNTYGLYVYYWDISPCCFVLPFSTVIPLHCVKLICGVWCPRIHKVGQSTRWPSQSNANWLKIGHVVDELYNLTVLNKTTFHHSSTTSYTIFRLFTHHHCALLQCLPCLPWRIRIQLDLTIERFWQHSGCLLGSSKKLVS